MYAPSALPDCPTDSYYGPPQETFYSRTQAYRPQYEDVKHLIDNGRLMHVFGDWEATDKDRETAQPWQGGFLTFDLNMRLIAKLDMRMAVGDLHPMAIQAALVARARPEDMKKGWPGYIGMAMYRDMLRAASRLDGERLGLETRTFEDGKSSFVYPLDFPDAERVELEIKESGEQFRLAGKKDWHKLYGETHFFNGDGFDIHLAAHTAARYNMPGLFAATRRAHAAIHLDPLAMARWVWAFGPQGKDGLQVSPRYHYRTKRDVLSFRQQDLLKANSPSSYRALGRGGGIRLFDGSEYDPEVAHGAFPDAAGTAALYVLLRQIDPTGIRFIESMANESDQKRFLQGNANFNDRPLVGFVDYDEGMISRGIGFLLETGDQHGQKEKNKVLIFNASAHDPEQVSKLTDSELKAGLLQKHAPIAVAFRTNRTCQIAEFERAYKAGAGHNLSVDEYNRRRLWLINHRHSMWRMTTNWEEIRNPPRPINITTLRPSQDDSFVHYGDLERIEALRDEPKDSYKRAQIKWDTSKKWDVNLKKYLEAHAVEYSDDLAALEDFIEADEKHFKALNKIQDTWREKVPLIYEVPTTIEQAIQYQWRKRLAHHDCFFNYLPERFIQDEHGQNLSVEDVMRIPYHVRIKMWQREDFATGSHLKPVFERNATLSTFRLLDMAFDEADPFYRNHVSPTLRTWWIQFYDEHFATIRWWYEGRVTEKTQGPPNLAPSDHPSMTVARSLYESGQIADAAATGKGSDYDRFVAHTPEGPQIQAAWDARNSRMLRQWTWNADRLEAMGYDPVNKSPILNDFFQVPREHVIRLVVPDSMLDDHRWHTQWMHHLVLRRPTDRQLQRKLERFNPEEDHLVLVGAATGMERLAAKAIHFTLPDTVDGHDALEAAHSAYASIGQKMGSHHIVLKCEQFSPIEGKRYVDESIQRVTLSSVDWAGLVDASAGSLPAPMGCLTRVLVRDIGQCFQRGPVRLSRLFEGQETGDEFQGSLAAAELITLEDLASLTDKEAWRYGKPTSADLLSQWKKVFANLSIRDPAQQKIWSLRLARPVNKETYTHFKPDAFPVAVYTPEPIRPRSVAKPRPHSSSIRRAA